MWLIVSWTFPLLLSSLWRHLQKMSGPAAFHKQVLTTQSAINNGSWEDASFFDKLSIQVTGLSGLDRVQIRGSNKLTKPADTDHEQQLGSDISTAGITHFVDMSVAWVKIRKSAADVSPGSTDAFLFMRRQGQ